MSLNLYLEITRSPGVKEPDPPSGLGRVVEGLPSWFDVSGLAEASIAAAAVQVAAISDLRPQKVSVNRRLRGLWFGCRFVHKVGHANPWDPIARGSLPRTARPALCQGTPRARVPELFESPQGLRPTLWPEYSSRWSTTEVRAIPITCRESGLAVLRARAGHAGCHSHTVWVSTPAVAAQVRRVRRSSASPRAEVETSD